MAMKDLPKPFLTQVYDVVPLQVFLARVSVRT